MKNQKNKYHVVLKDGSVFEYEVANRIEASEKHYNKYPEHNIIAVLKSLN
jgi:hypothetical protein